MPGLSSIPEKGRKEAQLERLQSRPLQWRLLQLLSARKTVHAAESKKISLHLAEGGCNVMHSGWQSSERLNLKRAASFDLKRSRQSLLSSSAHTFFFPETWETKSETECACDQEATRRRKRLSGQAVEKSLLTPASVGVLSEPAGMANER